MARILLLSNGHGETLWLLAGRELRDLGHDVQALPLAGFRRPYLQAKLPLA